MARLLVAVYFYEFAVVLIKIREIKVKLMHPKSIAFITEVVLVYISLIRLFACHCFHVTKVDCFDYLLLTALLIDTCIVSTE